MRKKSTIIKFALAALFLIGGLASIGSGIGPVVVGLVLAVAFALWGAADMRRRPAPPARPTAQLQPTAPARERCDVTIPERVGSCIKVYQYLREPFKPLPGAEDMALEMQASGDWRLTPVEDSTGITLLYHDRPFGYLEQGKRAEMVRDWLRRGDPLIIYLSNYGESGCTAAMAFYRDEQASMAYRESSVVRLTRYTGQDAQLALATMESGERLDLDEEDEAVVAVSDIGYLPKSAASRYSSEGAAGVFIDHVDYDDEQDRYIPYVKIYW